MARGIPTRFTFDAAAELAAIWSPDGKTIVFDSDRNGHAGLYRKAANGLAGEELLISDDNPKTPMSWSPDGKFVIYGSRGGKAWVLPLIPEKPGAPLKPFLLNPTATISERAQFSPDGRWVAYQSNESGRYEIYVVPFPAPGAKKQVSLAGGLFSALAT